MFTSETTEDLQRAARKAVRLHLAEYGHRDPSYLYDEVGQEAFCTFPRVSARMAERPTVYGPACEDAEGCEHESCPVWGECKPSPVTLARWAARDALRDVLARDRHGSRVPDDVRARLAQEAADMVTPHAQTMKPADRGVMTAWHAEATAETARLSWHRVAGDLQAFPTLKTLVDTASESTRGGSAAWVRAARVVRPDLGVRQAERVTRTRAAGEWARLTDALDTMRGVFGADMSDGHAVSHRPVTRKTTDGGTIAGGWVDAV